MKRDGHIERDSSNKRKGLEAIVPMCLFLRDNRVTFVEMEVRRIAENREWFLMKFCTLVLYFYRIIEIRCDKRLPLRKLILSMFLI